ncbi:MAG: DNA methyltransferase [Pseudomonadota bacterium]|jgi:hypothetical protein
MDNLQISRLRECIQAFDFKNLFINELGWSQAKSAKTIALTAASGQASTAWQATPIAELSGIVVFLVAAAGNCPGLPDRATRADIHARLSEIAHENLIIFIDQVREPRQSLWLWVKRDGTKRYPREHIYVKGQPGDLFVSKISGIVVDISEFDERGQFPLAQLAARMKAALDVERVTKKFFHEFETAHLDFLERIQGIPAERDRRWYASVLLHRLMFIWFLQRKHFLDGGNVNYLIDKLAHTRQQGSNRYYDDFLKPLFFEGFAKPKHERTAQACNLLGEIKYLNGGLFLPHRIEQDYPGIQVDDQAFENLYQLFGRYSWNLDDSPGGKDDEINPDVLGYIFEKYINQKAFGAYYTRPEITEYLCEHTIYALILQKINQPALPELNLPARQFDSVPDLLVKLDAELCRDLLFKVLPTLTLLDPACGSGAFLVAAMKTLINLYAAIVGRIKFLNDPVLTAWLKQTEAEHTSIHYYIKKSIITDNLYGVDIMEEATEIAKLRLFLTLVASARSVDDLEPLPNIDFNILVGNSLVGLTHVNPEDYEKGQTQDLFRQSYQQILEEKNRLIDQYRHGAEVYGEDLRLLRDSIDERKREAQARLNDLLLLEFVQCGIKFEQATWDAAKKKPGKAVKRALKIADIEALHPLHWGYEFDQIIQQRGGFDAILTNPPWEVLKPQAKEFFAEHSDLVTKNKMSIKDFEKEQAKLLRAPEVRSAWLEYLSRFPHLSAWFRAAPQFKHQSAMVGGKKTGSDINLYKLFTEQCFRLLRAGGKCGIVIPSGIYTDLGAKGLRDMLFDHNQITGLFCFENRKEIFEGVHRSFKFVVLTFEKGGNTLRFPAAFMRHDVAELAGFPRELGLPLAVDLVRRLSPDSASVMEFKCETDIRIAEKMLKFPLLGAAIAGTWNLRLSHEFHMTNDSHLFKSVPGAGRLPLFEGKMIWQFQADYDNPRYWVDEAQGRLAVLGRRQDDGQAMDYQTYRLGFRDIAANTNERTMVAAMIPPAFHGNKLPTVKVFDDTGNRAIDSPTLLFICAIWNSFILDWMLRQKVSTTLNFFYIYQLPVPRYGPNHAQFAPIVDRSARLTCTSPDFEGLAQELGLSPQFCGVTAPAERARLRAELDGLIAHLYGLSEAEFAHVLSTFPLVAEPVKIAALNAYRDAAQGIIS